MPVTPALSRLRQKDHELEASLGHIARPPSQKKKAELTGERNGLIILDFNITLSSTDSMIRQRSIGMQKT
jgi:hypothetical protein